MHRKKYLLVTHPRSGSTLLRLSLSDHPEIIAYDEVFLKGYSLDHGFDNQNLPLNSYIDLLTDLNFQQEYLTVREQHSLPTRTRDLTLEEKQSARCVILKVIALQRPFRNIKFWGRCFTDEYNLIFLNRRYWPSVRSLARVKAGEPAHSSSPRFHRASYSRYDLISAMVNIFCNKLLLTVVLLTQRLASKPVIKLKYEKLDSQLVSLQSSLGLSKPIVLHDEIHR